ncbi:NAD-dependent epimerase/dehydratase family protein [Tautonia rosea]|uniref:NAD-dependent epimerase/dehydratase family protein n=1 Tax=Tautonia rosea TaxID=2728037 RepID=UPI0014743513|nr:NAD-dependent epimerase/dehydratase family protein [Tautonia rosea]
MIPNGGLNERPCLVTGATGLLGSHIAERLVARGEPVRALVRATSDTRFLESLGVELVVGDLTDAESCAEALKNIRVVYHAAAKVGDWGTWDEFQSACLDATESLARAAIASGVHRFLHISSTSAYGHPPRTGKAISEDHPLGVGLWWPWDYYTISKVESERILWRLAREEGLPLTVIRPSWLYGERDRTTVARMIRRMRGAGIPVIGPGDNPLSAIYAGNVADACILAAEDPSSEHEAYNITDQGPMTQREFLRYFAEAAGAGPPRWYRRLPHFYPMVFGGSLVIEAYARLMGWPKAPIITRYATWLMARRIWYSTEKARSRLGWNPALGNAESIAQTVRWFLDQDTEHHNSLTVAAPDRA